MATKVELTSPLSSRTPQASLSDILNEVNTPRTYTSPLSDASNKSNDSSLTSPIIIAETDNLSSKSVSMLTVRSRPRLSPKPFSKEKPPDYRIGRNLMAFVSNDTPSRLATSTSENKQNNGSERMNRRIFRDSQQQSIEEKEATKAVAASFASTAEIQMQNPSNLGTPTNTAENVAFTSRSNEKEPSHKPEVPTKPPVISNALEKLQPKDTTSHLTSSRIYPSDVATEKNNKSSLEFESQDSSSVRAQLRPRRRPVSAVFLESINDPAPDRSEATDEKTCGRKPRPLSVDLTAKFETRGSLVHKNSFDETKENMPLKKDPTCSSITEENSELSLKQDGGLHEVRSKNHGNGSSRCQTTTEVFNRNKQSETSVKESVLNNTTKEKKDQDFGDGGETQSKVHLTEKSNARSTLQDGKPLFPESQGQPSDDIGITPGTINRRISLLLANSGSSVEVSESSTPEQGKGSSNVQQRIRGYSSENVEINLSKTQTFLQPQDHSSELTKTLSNSQPNEEIKETKTKEQQTFNVSPDSKKTMDTKDSHVSEEKQWTSWRSLRKSDWYQQSEASPDVSIENKSSLRKSDWYQQSEASPDVPIERKSYLRKSNWNPQSEASPDVPIESKSSLRKSDWYQQSEASPDAPIERKSSLRKSNWNQQTEASPDAPIESKSYFRKSDWYQQSEASPDAPIERKSSLRKSNWNQQTEASPDAPIESKSYFRKSDWYQQSEASPDVPIERKSSLRKLNWNPQSEASPDVPIERKSSLRKSNWNQQSEASPDAPIESKSSLRKSNWNQQSEASPDVPIESKSSLRKSDWYPQSEASPDVPIERKRSLRKSNWNQQSEASPDAPIESKSSLRKSDWYRQSEACPDVPNERKSLSSKEKTFDIATENTSEMEKIVGGNEFRTVRATMFEHNIERHNIERHSVNESGLPRQTVPDKHTKSNSPANESRGWTDCQEGDNSAKYQQGTEMLNTIIPQAGVLEKSSHIASHSPYTCTNVEVDLSKQRIEPRYEIVQTIGEKVSSESIQLLPEQNVRTLRSRRSFSKKEIEQERSELDGDMHDRPWSRLQRSKSEYRKRNTQGSSQGSFKDKDFNLEDKYDFRTEIRPPIIATADNVFKTDRTGLNESKADALKIYAVQDKDYKTEKAKLWEESKLWAHLKEKESSKGLEHSSFRSPTENQTVSAKELQGGGQRDFLKSQTYHASKGSAENDAQIASMIDSKDETGVYGEQFHSSRVRNFKENENQPYRSFIKNDSELLHKSTSRDESMDEFESVLNNGIEQMKKNLSAHSSSMETKLDSRIDEYFTEQKWKREKLFPLNDSSKVENTSDLITSTTNEVSTRNRGVADKNQDILNKFPQDTKATYFAVTCFDKKEKNESDLGTSINFQSGNLVVKEDSNNRLYVPSHNNFYSDSGDGKQDFQIRRESNIKSTIRCQAIVESDFTVKSDVMGSEILRPNTIDLDLLQERHRQEPYDEESRLTYRDSSAELSAKDYDHKSDNKSHREAEHFDLKGTYRSQVVDIDALMVDYKVSQNKSDNPDQGKSWERSRSFRECSEKKDSRKWKDPDVKPFTYKEGIKYETVSSWYTSQEHSEHELKTEDLKFTQFKNEGRSTDFNNTDTVETDNLKHQSISKNIRTLDALLDSSRGRQRDHKSSTSLLQNSYDLETERQPSKSFTKEAGFIELSVDDDDDEDDIRLKHQTPSQTASKSSVVEKKPTYSERRRPAKSSDLVALILEDKERRRQNRLKQGPTDEYNAQPLSQRHFSEQEHIQSGNKRHSQDYSTSIYHSKTVEVVTESSHRRSAKQQRVRAELPQLDQLKQCVTRSSTTNKDTDSLVQESDKRYGTWSQEQQQSEDGFVADSPSFGDISNRKHTPQSRLSSVSQSETDQHDFLSDPKSSAVDASSMDIDSTDGTGSTISLHEAKAEDFSFIDQTLVLDSTALKTRVQLNRKSQRRAPSQSQRKSRLLLSSSHLDVIEDTDSPWMYTDSTEEKPVKEESEEEKPQRTPVQQQRMPMFPGMDPSALKAQLRKRQDPENNSESPSQPSRSPKSPLPQGTLGIKLLPTSSDKQERGPEESPAWLKELKSKKRLSQYENQT